MPYRDSDPVFAKPEPLWKFWAGAIFKGTSFAAFLFLLVMGLAHGCESCNESAERTCLRDARRAAERYEEIRDECRSSGRVWHENTTEGHCPGFYWSGGGRPSYTLRIGECWDREEK